ncbi:MAG: dihydropteroate synthase [Thermoplasmata archaeon]|nr:dihydropteroate synthase [Thermoplasmata archaeon]
MGIINVTPDSFSGDGLAGRVEEATMKAWEMKDGGADIIDVGGESSRPFSDPVPPDEEKRRVYPVLEELRDLPIPISVDTYKPDIARGAIERGASIVNDIYGLRSPGMVDVIREFSTGCVIMHMKGTPKDMQISPKYDRVMIEVSDFLRDKVYMATSEGVIREGIILDPGIGFGKEVEHNLQLIKRISYLFPLNRPVLIGASRKSFIGKITGKDVEGRLAGSIAAATTAYLMGADILRVHDVPETRDALNVASAILKESI